KGRIGRAIVAIRDNHIAAEAMGINTALYKSLVFGVSAAYTGVAGALSASVIAYVAPDSFNVFLSVTLLIGSVIGGLASISGAVFGALFIQFVPNWAQDISKAAPWAIFGVFLIGFMYLMPFGIAGGIRLLWIRATRSRVQQGERRGWHQRPEDQLHHLRRCLHATQNRRDGAQAGRAGSGRRAVPDARHADQYRHPQVRQPAEGAAPLRGHRRHQVGRPEELPVDDGLPA